METLRVQTTSSTVPGAAPSSAMVKFQSLTKLEKDEIRSSSAWLDRASIAEDTNKDDDTGFPSLFEDEVASVPMLQATGALSSKGNISYDVSSSRSCSVNIPSNSGERNFTIAKLNLGASMSWICGSEKVAKGCF
jgi:hypothetical protein